jgi:hypothetical protein
MKGVAVCSYAGLPLALFTAGHTHKLHIGLTLI